MIVIWKKLVELLKETHIAGNSDFLASLDPTQVARELNAPQFVRKAIENGGWSDKFKLQNGWTRTEEIAV